MGKGKRHLFVVPDHQDTVPEQDSWLDTAFMDAASRLVTRRDSELSRVGRRLKQEVFTPPRGGTWAVGVEGCTSLWQGEGDGFDPRTVHQVSNTVAQR